MKFKMEKQTFTWRGREFYSDAETDRLNELYDLTQYDRGFVNLGDIPLAGQIPFARFLSILQRVGGIYGMDMETYCTRFEDDKEWEHGSPSITKCLIFGSDEERIEKMYRERQTKKALEDLTHLKSTVETRLKLSLVRIQEGIVYPCEDLIKLNAKKK